MRKESLLKRIRQEFPKLKWEKHRYITSGWDHHVVVLDEKLVFRTPKRPDSDPSEELLNEIGLLHYLKDKVKINIPHYQYISATWTLAGYKMLDGKELDKKLFKRLKPVEKAAAVEQYARFITSLHSVPKSVVGRYNVRIENECRLQTELVRKVRKKIFPRMHAKHIGLIEQYLQELTTSIGWIRSRTLIHNDLTGEHILWDGKRRQINIIDFSDRCYGDPAADFAGIMEYGKEFVKKVYALYGCRKDEGLLHRAELYYKRISLYMMIDSLEGFPCTFKQGYEMFEERFGI